MKLKNILLAVLALLPIVTAGVMLIIGNLNQEKPLPEGKFTVRGKEYGTEEYLTGCVYAMLKNYSSAEDIDPAGLNAAAAAEMSSLRYLISVGGLESGVFPKLEYMSGEEAREYYGGGYASIEKAVKDAVSYALDTRLTYEGKDVFLPVCRISSGALIDPDDCGLEMPWLKKLYCLSDSKEPRYSGACQLTADGFSSVLLGRYPTLVLPPDTESWITDIVTDEDKNVLSVRAGGIDMSGWEFCSIFGIRSVCFELSYSQGLFSFSSKGDGGSIGMSVSAAMKLGETGKTAEEIIKTFFDVEISKI